MKWRHSRKGIIEGEIVREAGDFVHIKLANKVHVGHGDPPTGRGFRDIRACPGTTISVRKALLTEIKGDCR